MFRSIALSLPDVESQVQARRHAFAHGGERFAMFDPNTAELALRLPGESEAWQRAKALGQLQRAGGKYGADGWTLVDHQGMEEELFTLLLAQAHASVEGGGTREARRMPSRSRQKKETGRKASGILPLAMLILGGFLGERVSAADILANLRPQHPRLQFLASDFERTKSFARSDSLTGLAFQSLQRRAEILLAKDPPVYALDQSQQLRLLQVSRYVLERISVLSAMHRMTGDARYRLGAQAVMRAVVQFENWHPSHFLDVAEMTHAMALGYDWLHDSLSTGLRDSVREAIAQKGLRPGMEVYRGKADKWWVTSTSNWNQVCNAGLALGALAIAEDSADLSRRVMDSAMLSIRSSMGKSYAPDGGFPEGLGYWEYGTNYAVYLLCALQNALGSTFGLLESPGFSQTPTYRLQMVGPTKLRFDYSDASTTDNFVGSMFWFAKTFGQPFYARKERTNPGTPDIFALLWYDPELAARADTTALPLAVRYQNLDVAVFRSSWTDPDAWYVGFKGGDNRATHAHLDLGSFVLDQGGVRWAADLGSDNYLVPGYLVNTDKQDGAHWTMYRTRTESHNTLTLSATTQFPLAFANQSINAKAHLVAGDAGDNPWAVADLTEAYAAIPGEPRQLDAVRRGVRLWSGEQFLVQDEIKPHDSVEVVWNLVTEATPTLAGDMATLTRKGKSMMVQILSPSGARFDTVTCHPPDPRTQAEKDSGVLAQNPNNGYSKLVVRLPRTSDSVRLAVRFHPAGTTPDAPAIVPLGQWKTETTIKHRSPSRAIPGRGLVAWEAATGRRIVLEMPLDPGAHLVAYEGRMRLLVVP